VGDVGQDLYEEIDIVRKGENYGWNVMEGFERYSNKYRRDGETFVPPIFSWTRKYGAHVPQADLCIEPIPNRLFMASIFSPTYQKKNIFALTQKDRVLDQVHLIANAPQSVVSFGRDMQRQIYFVGYEGNIYKLDLDSSRFE